MFLYCVSKQKMEEVRLEKEELLKSMEHLQQERDELLKERDRLQKEYEQERENGTQLRREVQVINQFPHAFLPQRCKIKQLK